MKHQKNQSSISNLDDNQASKYLSGDKKELLLKALQEDAKTEKVEKKESKEKVEKSLEFEENTFKIDSTGWREEERKANDQLIKVKVNPTEDVVEYLDGPAKGEQIFIGYDVFLREVCKAKNCSKEEAEKKYLMTEEEFKQKMVDKPNNSEEYKKFFDKEIKGNLTGFWSPRHKEFLTLGKASIIWMAGAWVADMTDTHSTCYIYNRDYGVGARLLKN